MKNIYVILVILNVVMVFLSGYLSVHYFMEGTQSGIICGVLWTLACACWVGCTIFNTINTVRNR